MAKDRYVNWNDLITRRNGLGQLECVAGVQFVLVNTPGTAGKSIHIAIHGGGIEQATTACAQRAVQLSVAGTGLYSFKALTAPNRTDGTPLDPPATSDMHITASKFDEPTALNAVTQAARCLSWHGMANPSTGPVKATYVGGLDYSRAAAIRKELTDAGFFAAEGSEELNGDDPKNIANKTLTSAGVQLEISLAQRQAFSTTGDISTPVMDNPANWSAEMQAYVAAVVRGFQATTDPYLRPFAATAGASRVMPDVTLSQTRVHQQISHDEVDNLIYATQVIGDTVQLADEVAVPPVGTREARGDFVINRVNSSGSVTGTMWVRQFGRGTSVNVERDQVTGDVYLWVGTDSDNPDPPLLGRTGLSRKVGRMKFVNNKIVDYNTFLPADMQVFDPFEGPTNVDVSVDLVFGHIAASKGIANDRKEITYWNFEKFKAGDFSAPLGKIRQTEYEDPQTFCLFGSYVYSIYGRAWSTSNPAPPDGLGNFVMVVQDVNTGRVMTACTRNGELHLTNREPESIAIFNARSNPALTYGYGTGVVGARKMTLYQYRSRMPYRSWAQLTAEETAGVDYAVVTSTRVSKVAHLAIHGGSIEYLTDNIAAATAVSSNGQYFGFQGKKTGDPPFNNYTLAIPSALFDNPTAEAIQAQSDFSFSYHGRSNAVGDPSDGLVYVGGLDYANRDRTAQSLINRGFNVAIGGRESCGNGDQNSANSITNRNRQGAGVQLELTLNLRDRMVVTGDASDTTAAKTQVFFDFVAAVAYAANNPAAPQGEKGEQGCLRYFINDHPMNRRAGGYRLLEGTEYAPAISPRRFNLEIPGYHGQIPMWNDPLEPMKVGMLCEITGTNQSSLRQRWDRFYSLLGAGKYRRVKLERYRGIYLSSDTDFDPLADHNRSFGEYAWGQLESMSSPDYNHSRKMLRTQLVFNVPAGQWRSNKEYTETFLGNGRFYPVLSRVSTSPVYSMHIRVQGGPGSGVGSLYHWSLVDGYSDTGFAWDDPVGDGLPSGQWLYCSTNTMRCYTSTVKDWPDEDEDFFDFVARINGQPSWADFRYVFSGPLQLTHEMSWNEDNNTFDRSTSLNVAMRDKNGVDVTREIGIQARAART